MIRVNLLNRNGKKRNRGRRRKRAANSPLGQVSSRRWPASAFSSSSRPGHEARAASGVPGRIPAAQAVLAKLGGQRQRDMLRKKIDLTTQTRPQPCPSRSDRAQPVYPTGLADQANSSAPSIRGKPCPVLLRYIRPGQSRALEAVGISTRPRVAGSRVPEFTLQALIIHRAGPPRPRRAWPEVGDSMRTNPGISSSCWPSSSGVCPTSRISSPTRIPSTRSGPNGSRSRTRS
jgi:hypothetical protein